LAEGEGFEPILPSFDKRATEGFEPFWKFARITFTSPSSIPLYEWPDATTMLRENGSEHSHPPELGARIERSLEASLATAQGSLQMDIRVEFEPFAGNGRLQLCIILGLPDL
jgi:hypothetical protein